VSADNGQDAVDKFKQHAETLEIVLMDINMPGMNGEQKCYSFLSFRTH
jgi:YesN/AraC family two-component response regulator